MAVSMRKSLYGRQLGISDTGALIGAGRASNVKIGAVAGAANIANVTYQVVDFEDNPVAGVRNMLVFLSDTATSGGLTTTSASGSVQSAGTGFDLYASVSKKAITVQTDTTGKYVLAITDTAKTLFYPCCQLSEGSGVIVGTQLITGSYG